MERRLPDASPYRKSYLVGAGPVGRRVRKEIGNACFEYSYGLAKLKVCLSEIDISGGQLKSVTISIELCVGAFGLEKCWTIYKGKIKFLLLDTVAMSALGIGNDEVVYAYLDDEGVNDEESADGGAIE
jgi:hypothetical protein